MWAWAVGLTKDRYLGAYDVGEMVFLKIALMGDLLYKDISVHMNAHTYPDPLRTKGMREKGKGYGVEPRSCHFVRIQYR